MERSKRIPVSDRLVGNWREAAIVIWPGVLQIFFRILLFLGLVVVLPPKLFAQHHLEITRYDLSVSVDYERGNLSGLVEMTWRNAGPETHEINVDLIRDFVRVHSIRIDGQPVPNFRQESNVLRLPLPFTARKRSLKISLEFESVPSAFMQVSRPNADDRTAPEMFTIIDGLRSASHWFPCFDRAKKGAAKINLRVTVPEGSQVIAGGVFKENPIAVDPKRGTQTFSFSFANKRPSEISMIAGHFHWNVENYDGTRIILLYPPEDERFAKQFFGGVRDILKEQETQFHRSQIPLVVAENYPLAGEFTHDVGIFDGEVARSNRMGLLVHELKHPEWPAGFHGRDLWIQEGWVVYVSNLALARSWAQKKSRSYRDTLNDRMDKLFEQYREENRSNPRALKGQPHKPFAEYYDDHTYSKGALIFRMLDSLLGEGFDGAMNEIKREWHDRAITTATFKKNVAAYSGRQSLDWFFDQWLNGSDHPKISWWWKPVKIGNRFHAEIHLHQLNSRYYELPMKFRVYTAGGAREFSYTPPEKSSMLLSPPYASEPTLVLADPERELLWERKFDRSEKEYWKPEKLFAMAKQTYDVVAQKEAINELKQNIPDEWRDDFFSLCKSLATTPETFPSVTSAALGAMEWFPASRVVSLFLEQIDSSNSEIRNAAFKGLMRKLPSVPARGRDAFNVILRAAKKNATVNAGLALVSADPRRAETEIIRWLDETTVPAIKRAPFLTALAKLAARGSTTSLERIRHYLSSESPAFRFEAASACVEQQLAGFENEMKKHLLAVDEPSALVRGKAVRYFKAIKNSSANEFLRFVSSDDPDAEIRKGAEKALAELNKLSPTENASEASAKPPAKTRDITLLSFPALIPSHEVKQWIRPENISIDMAKIRENLRVASEVAGEAVNSHLGEGASLALAAHLEKWIEYLATQDPMRWRKLTLAEAMDEMKNVYAPMMGGGAMGGVAAQLMGLEGLPALGLSLWLSIVAAEGWNGQLHWKSQPETIAKLVVAITAVDSFIRLIRYARTVGTATSEGLKVASAATAIEAPAAALFGMTLRSLLVFMFLNGLGYAETIRVEGVARATLERNVVESMLLVDRLLLSGDSSTEQGEIADAIVASENALARYEAYLEWISPKEKSTREYQAERKKILDDLQKEIQEWNNVERAGGWKMNEAPRVIVRYGPDEIKKFISNIHQKYAEKLDRLDSSYRARLNQLEKEKLPREPNFEIPILPAILQQDCRWITYAVCPSSHRSMETRWKEYVTEKLSRSVSGDPEKDAMAFFESRILKAAERLQ